MSELITTINQWHWWSLAVVLLILEAFAPGAFFVSMSVAAIVVGLLLAFMPELAMEYQLFVFTLLSVGTIVAARRFLGDRLDKSDQPTLNQRGQKYVGRTFTLAEPIENGYGKIRVDDSTWKVQGEDCGPNGRVRVTAADGVVLMVEKADD